MIHHFAKLYTLLGKQQSNQNTSGDDAILLSRWRSNTFSSSAYFYFSGISRKFLI